MARCFTRACLVAASAFALAAVPAAHASFPGQNGKIAFAATGGVHTINPDGTGLSQVAADARWPAWSADGRRLAYFVDGIRNSPTYGLNVANADGSGQVRIKPAVFSSDQFSSHEDVFEEPAWSPDGGTIAYEAIEIACSHPTCIYYVEGVRGIAPDGGGDHLVVDYPAGDPSYSPDGTQIAWDDNTQAYPANVHVSNADGTGDTVLTADGGGFDPSWSPDGARIAFARYVDCCNAEIHVMNADGSDKRRLTVATGHDHDPVWSPDGTKIAWNRDTGLWVMNADGSEQGQLTSGGMPDWQPLLGPRRADYKNAAQFCKAELRFLGSDGFRQKYGSLRGCKRSNRS